MVLHPSTPSGVGRWATGLLCKILPGASMSTLEAIVRKSPLGQPEIL